MLKRRHSKKLTVMLVAALPAIAVIEFGCARRAAADTSVDASFIALGSGPPYYWSDTNNWQPAVLPNNSPGTNYYATLDYEGNPYDLYGEGYGSVYPVNLDTSPIINGLTLDGSGVTGITGGTETITISNTFTSDSGELTLSSGLTVTLLAGGNMYLNSLTIGGTTLNNYGTASMTLPIGNDGGTYTMMRKWGHHSFS